jgi:hypothetical protein
MVARLLNLSGLYLGREEDLYTGASDNPEGFWENRHFVELNDEILAHFGGGWDLPPTLPERWELQPEVSHFLERAAVLKAQFSQGPIWGWKDPRNSLTIGFWTQLIPDLRVLVCVRDPVEVMESLRKRGYSSPAFGFNLWRSYYRSLFAVVPIQACVVTHYDAYFSSPEEELRRVSMGLGMPVSDQKVREACKSISATLRHNRGSSAPSSAIPADVRLLYKDLCARAKSLQAAQEAGAVRVSNKRPEQFLGRVRRFLFDPTASRS